MDRRLLVASMVSARIRCRRIAVYAITPSTMIEALPTIQSARHFHRGRIAAGEGGGAGTLGGGCGSMVTGMDDQRSGQAMTGGLPCQTGCAGSMRFFPSKIA